MSVRKNSRGELCSRRSESLIPYLNPPVSEMQQGELGLQAELWRGGRSRRRGGRPRGRTGCVRRKNAAQALVDSEHPARARRGDEVLRVAVELGIVDERSDRPFAAIDLLGNLREVSNRRP